MVMPAGIINIQTNNDDNNNKRHPTDGMERPNLGKIRTLAENKT